MSNGSYQKSVLVGDAGADQLSAAARTKTALERPGVGVLFGYGSIGRHHARALSRAGSELFIVDINEEVRSRAGQDHQTARVARDLDELDRAGLEWSDALGVIATLGPSHSELFHALADRGVRRILCEKPLANSVARAKGMIDRAESDGIALAVHHYIRWARLVPALREFAAVHALGEPVGLHVEGGAGGLETNGIHWVDCATELFGCDPRAVTSTARGEPINPRSRELLFFGGTAVWDFERGRETVISFNNASSLALIARVLYRDAIVQMDSNMKMTIARRDPAAVERFPAVTRTGPAGEHLFEGQLPGVLSFDEWLDKALDEVRSGEIHTAPGRRGYVSVSACIGALVAAREKRAIELPLDPQGPLGREAWPIS